MSRILIILTLLATMGCKQSKPMCGADEAEKAIQKRTNKIK